MNRNVDFDIEGMTCASCAARIEKKLNRIDGVVATVNFATEQAHVELPPTVTPDEVVSTVEQLGYHAQLPQPSTEADADATAPADPVATLRQRLMVSTVLTVPVVAMAMIPALQFTNWQWLALTLSAPVAVWGALPFHRAAWVNARHGTTTMDTLISVGVLASFGWSVFALFWGTAGMPGMHMELSLLGSQDAAGDIYLEVAAGVTCFILAGRYLEARAKRQSGEALRALLDLAPTRAVVVRDGVEVEIPAADLRVGELFVVRPGQQIATDGVIVEGSSAVDNSLITGESVPLEVGPDDAVVGAALNAGGRLLVRATRVGSDTQLAQIAALVTHAQQGKAPVQRLADRVASVFVPVVIGISLVTFLAWLAFGGSVTDAFSAAVAVLIIACPCALGLATPTALLVGTGRGAQLGILIKGPEVLESTRRVDTVVLDKTGTITTGQMSVVDTFAAPGVSLEDLVRRSAGVEHASEHPVARAIAAQVASDSLPSVSDFRSSSGFGVTGDVDGRHVAVGRLEWVWDQGMQPDASVAAWAAQSQQSGSTVVAVGWDGQVCGAIAVADTVKPTSRQAVSALRSLGLRPYLLTGDHAATATAVARDVGIDAADVIAQVTPQEKSTWVEKLQRDSAVVAMVGDGVNDSAALVQADLGIAMGTGTDAAISASDLTLVRGDLMVAADAIALSRRVLHTIKGNLFWAFAYNVAAIPLAAAGLLNPLLAGLAMAFSSVFVVTNSLRLRGFTPQPHTE